MWKAESRNCFNSPALLGEGALWNPLKNLLLWIDIENKFLCEFNPLERINIRYPMPERIGTAVPRKNGGYIVALESGIAVFNPPASLEFVNDPERDLPDNRFNDGKCDPAGRLWAGTMSMKKQKQAGSLYRFTGTSECEKVIGGVTTSNGICWNTERNRMFYIDTPTLQVQMFDYDNESGEISDPQIVFQFSGEFGKPDGMTIDTQNNLWIAMFGGYGVSVVKIHPDEEQGELIGWVDVPARQITSCTFGGDEMSTLFITSASKGLSEEELRRYPQSGGVFCIETEYTGWAQEPFHG